MHIMSSIQDLSSEEIIEYAKQYSLSKRKTILECGMTEFTPQSSHYNALEHEWQRVMDFIQDRNM